MRGRRGRPTGSPAGHAEDPSGDPESVARSICLRQLAAAPRTRAQLAETLARRGVPDDAADRVLARFGEVGLIDDAMFAQTWVSSRHVGRGLAKRALSAELRQRGVDAETTQDAVAALDADTEEATARELVRRRLRTMASVEPAVAQRRLLGMLGRKGYSAGLAYRVIRDEMAPTEADADELLPPDDT
jgi:regulatory protein